MASGTARNTAQRGVPIDDLVVSAYRIPTDTPDESDGTYVWNSTTLVDIRTSCRDGQETLFISDSVVIRKSA